MKHTRRGFFATLLAAVAAPLVAKVIPKRKTTGTLFDPHADIHAQWMAYRQGAHSFYYDPAATPVMELWPKPIPQELLDAIRLKEYFHGKLQQASYDHSLAKFKMEQLITSRSSAPVFDPPSRQS